MPAPTTRQMASRRPTAPAGGLLARAAAMVQAAGRDGDTIVAHINPREAELLRRAGGRGTRNPHTGLLEFATASNFDRDLYLQNNPDVAAAGVDPWEHYQTFGRTEGRAANAAEVSARQEGYTGQFGDGGYVAWKAQQQAPAPPPPPPQPTATTSTPNSLPGTGTIRNLKLPNGATIQMREDDPDFAATIAAGAVDQSSPEAAKYTWESWYRPGGQGYLDAMKAGHNDPNSDPTNPQPFSASALQAAGINPATYAQARGSASQNGPFVDYGSRPEFNQQFVAWLQSQGYSLPFNDMGEGQAGAWMATLPAADQAKINAWLDANDPARKPASTTQVAPKTTEQIVSDILQAESPLMQRAASQGLMLANRRGLLNSTVAAEAAQAAMIDAAVPIASADANLANQRWLQQQDIANQRAMQQQDIASKNWQAQLDAETRTRIAQMQVATADREKIGTMVANIQAQHTSRINNIISNPEIPAETRAQYLADADQWMRHQLDMLEGMYGIQLDWNTTA
ncbi:MAG: hypothetical protein LDL44_03650 [Caenispirillum sp.]|nr:hypothetical protein [Caenispirillum sp.]